MAKTNEQLHRELLEEARHLVSTHEYGNSRNRTARLREVVYLLDAHEAGQDITLAKLSYDASDANPIEITRRLRHHLGPKPSFQAYWREDDEAWKRQQGMMGAFMIVREWKRCLAFECSLVAAGVVLADWEAPNE